MTTVTGYAFSFVEIWALLLLPVALAVLGVGHLRDRRAPTLGGVVPGGRPGC